MREGIETPPTCVVLAWNRGAEALFGYSASAAIGQPLAALVGEVPADPGEHVASWRHQSGAPMRADVVMRVIAAAPEPYIAVSARPAAAALENLATLAHELRTPLNTIIGFTELVRRGKAGPVTERQQEYLDDSLTSARQLLQRINGVLDRARRDGGGDGE